MYTSHKETETKCLVIGGNFIKLLNKKIHLKYKHHKNNQMINILTSSHHT